MKKTQVTNQSMSFKKKMIATAVASVMAAGFSPVGFAQEDGAVEEVVVTGIRASLQRSMDQKREAVGVVDVISAEDIGKFPDTNLAESLQRVPGVSIDRSGGEGTRITVRGIGSDFNLVTQNGRTIARTTGGRGYDFANIASEMVTAVSIAKTSNAMLDSGGMGSTVDIKSIRPLSNPGQKMAVSAKMMDDQSTNSGSATPEVFGLYSNTFADDTIGIAVSAAYQERESGSAVAEVGTGWRSFEGTVDQDWSGAAGANPQWGGVPKTNQVNRPGQGDIYSVPQTTIYRFSEEQRERLNGQLVLQWQPTDTVKATLDYDMYERTVHGQTNDVSAWFTFAPSRNVWTDGPVSSPLIYSETYFTRSDAVVGDTCNDNPGRKVIGGANGERFCPEDLSMAAGISANKFTGDTLGLNLEWDVTDRLSLAFDAAFSDADRTPDSNLGSSASLSTAAFIRTSATSDFTGDIPTLIVGGGNAVQPTNMIVTGGVVGNSEDHSTVDQYQAKGKFEFDDINSINFGISSTEISNQSQSINVQRNDWGGVGKAGDLAAVFVGTEASVGSYFDGSFSDFSSAKALTDAGLVTGNRLADGTLLSPENIQDKFFKWDYVKGRAAAEALYNTPAALAKAPWVGDCGNGPSVFCPSDEYDRDTDRTTVETTTAVYLQYNFESELAAMPFQAHAGVRYEETEVESTSATATYDGAVWIGDTEIELQSTGMREYLTKTASYDHYLPNLDLSLEVVDGLILRAAASKTIGRADYNSLKGGTVVNGLANRNNGGGSVGNPALKPLESVNFDLSAEWYFAETSYASIGYFQKEVSNFISNDKVTAPLWDIRNPGSGPKVDQALAAGSSGNAAIRSWIFNNLANAEGVDADKKRIAGVASDDFLNFEFDIPVNGTQDRSIDGWEFAVQHMFGETGFGAQANYTLVDSDLTYDNFLLTDQEALLGLSDSANLVGFYENYGWNVRVAYNWRDQFLSSRGQGTGANPQYTEEYAQIDLSVSYDVTDDLQVFLQGINVTDEANRVVGRSDRQVLSYTETGARWMVGANYSF
jgi:TonB-dependent receptor